MLELLLYLALFSMLLPVITGGFVTVAEVWNQTTDRIEAREQAVTLLHRIEAEVREGYDFSVQPNGLTFRNANGQLVQYQLGSRGLLLRNGGAGITVIGANVATCFFQTQDGGQSVHLFVTTKVGQAKETVDQVWYGRGHAS